MNRLLIVEKATRIMKLKKAAYRLYSMLYNPIYKHFTPNEGIKYLDRLSPDKGKSCICRNNISSRPEFDLQIIVPVYNAEKYVKECIDSILSQKTHYSFLLVIVDDGSTDSGPEELKRYEDRDNVILIHQENRGHGGGRNRALANINARYVMFVDADDCLPENAVENLMDTAVRTGADVVEGGFIHFHDNIRIYGKTYTDGPADPLTLDGVPWGKIYDAHLFSRVRFPEGYWFEDTLNRMIVYPLANKAYRISDIVYRWRRNSRSISRVFKGNPKALDTFYVTKRLLDDAHALDIAIDTPYLDMLLVQFQVNILRIQTLDDINAQAAHFCLCRHILAPAMDRIDTSALSPRAKNMYRAIATDDFKTFLLTGLFL